jgi:hypothetical protein
VALADHSRRCQARQRGLLVGPERRALRNLPRLAVGMGCPKIVIPISIFRGSALPGHPSSLTLLSRRTLLRAPEEQKVPCHVRKQCVLTGCMIRKR